MFKKVPAAIEITYIAETHLCEVAHSKVYTEAERNIALHDFNIIREKMPDAPVRCISCIGGKVSKKYYGKEYDFDNMSLLVKGRTEMGSEISYLARKYISGCGTIEIKTKKGPKLIGFTVDCVKQSTEEERMNLMNEHGFDRFRFIEDVIR